MRVNIRRQMIPACAIVAGLTAAVVGSGLRHSSPMPIEHQTEPAQDVETPYQFLLQTKQELLELFCVHTGNNTWDVSFDVVETYSDGATVVKSFTVQMAKNSKGSIDLGYYTLVYDISGNGSNIKQFYIII